MPRIAEAGQHVYEHLRRALLVGELVAGDRLVETELAESLGVSRTPVREALKVLASEGLVTLQPRRGCVVTEVSEDDAEQLFPVMALLEGRCAYEAALHASDDELAELRLLHGELERHAAAHDADGYYRANHVFHTRVQEVAHNGWLSRATDQLRGFMRMLRGRQLAQPGRFEASIAEHRELLDALCARDAERAQRLMHDHLMAQLAALKALRASEAAQSRVA